MMRSLLLRHRQFLVFVTGGLLCALIDIGIMQSLIATGVGYAMATLGGFASGLLFNYLFHAKLTFGTSANSFNFLRFLCVVGLNYMLTLGCVALAVHTLPLTLDTASLVGKLVSLPLVAVNGFLLSKYWIFT